MGGEAGEYMVSKRMHIFLFVPFFSPHIAGEIRIYIFFSSVFFSCTFIRAFARSLFANSLVCIFKCVRAHVCVCALNPL